MGAQTLQKTRISEWLTYFHQELPASFTTEEDVFQFRGTTSFEINRIIQSFPSNKAPAKDKLHMAVVKDASDFNRDYKKFTFDICIPSPWKESEIVPIPKNGGDPEIANENSTVSLLPALSKICEREIL
mgnify:FL=1